MKVTTQPLTKIMMVTGMSHTHTMTKTLLIIILPQSTLMDMSTTRIITKIRNIIQYALR